MGYSDDLKINDALQLYFSRYHFVNGGYDLKWFRIKVGPLFIPLPNTKARVEAVKIHDIHHLLTEYTATLRGEAEIGGWEIASGCGRYYVAWILNFGSFFYGMFFFPKPLLTAFLRGRRCTTNLYHGVCYNADLLERTVGELRESVGTNNVRKNRIFDYLLFALCSSLVLAAAFGFFYALYIVIALILGLF